MKTEHEMIRVKLENMRARAIKRREVLVESINMVDCDLKATERLLATLKEMDGEPT